LHNRFSTIFYPILGSISAVSGGIGCRAASSTRLFSFENFDFSLVFFVVFDLK
jgi:hypothetical protein